MSRRRVRTKTKKPVSRFSIIKVDLGVPLAQRSILFSVYDTKATVQKWCDTLNAAPGDESTWSWTRAGTLIHEANGYSPWIIVKDYLPPHNKWGEVAP